MNTIRKFPMPKQGERIRLVCKPFDDSDDLFTDEVIFFAPTRLGDWMVDDDLGHQRCFLRHTIVEWEVVA